MSALIMQTKRRFATTSTVWCGNLATVRRDAGTARTGREEGPMLTPTEDEVRRRDRELERAAADAALHVSSEDGFCLGCVSVYGRWMLAQRCPDRARAVEVLATAGVTEDLWDRPVRGVVTMPVAPVTTAVPATPLPAGTPSIVTAPASVPAHAGAAAPAAEPVPASAALTPAGPA